MDVMALLHKTLLFAMGTWDVKDRLNCKWNISGVVKHEFIRNLRVCKLLKESLILIRSNFSFLSIPDGTKRIHSLAIQFNGIADELGEFLNDFLYHDVLTKLTRLW